MGNTKNQTLLYTMDMNQYNVEGLLADESFQQFCSGTNEQSILFWNQKMIENPGLKEKIEEAKMLFHFLNGGQGNLKDEKEKVWSRIKQETPVNGMVRPLYKWMSAAAVILVAILGFWMWMGSSESGANGTKPIASNLPGDIMPGGNKAILTLADGTKVILDSANNGAITKQGNVTVIKLNDGLLSYEKTTDTNMEVVYNTITTPRGGQYQLVLVDGSKVWLNAASSIKFPNVFNGNERRIELTGEGYFEVEHDVKKPFYVNAGGIEVKVLGTHFNVNSYADESSVKTTLLQGSVKVIEGANSKTIVPGMQAQVSGNGNISTLQVDVKEVVAWKNGKFIFDNANIRSIMRQLEKWYDIEVEYQTIDTDETFMGSISRNVNLSQILDMLEKTGSLKFQMVGRRIIVQ